MAERSINFRKIPVEDYTAPEKEDLTSLIEEILAAKAKHPSKGVALHCTAGSGRTGTMILYLKQILSPVDGLDFCRGLLSIGTDYSNMANEEIND